MLQLSQISFTIKKYPASYKPYFGIELNINDKEKYVYTRFEQKLMVVDIFITRKMQSRTANHQMFAKLYESKDFQIKFKLND